MKKGTMAGIVLLVLLFGLSVFIAGKAAGFETQNPEVTTAYEIAAMSRFYAAAEAFENETLKKEILNYVGIEYKDFDPKYIRQVDTHACLGPSAIVAQFYQDALKEIAKK